MLHEFDIKQCQLEKSVTVLHNPSALPTNNKNPPKAAQGFVVVRRGQTLLTLQSLDIKY